MHNQCIWFLLQNMKLIQSFLNSLPGMFFLTRPNFPLQTQATPGSAAKHGLVNTWIALKLEWSAFWWDNQKNKLSYGCKENPRLGITTDKENLWIMEVKASQCRLSSSFKSAHEWVIYIMANTSLMLKRGFLIASKPKNMPSSEGF